MRDKSHILLCCRMIILSGTEQPCVMSFYGKSCNTPCLRDDLNNGCGGDYDGLELEAILGFHQSCNQLKIVTIH